MASRLLTLVILFLAATSGIAQTPKSTQRPVAPQRPVTRSPHGALNMACENCHTFSAWKPIRNIPEFNHDQTKFPLRGLHQDVACKQCHTKLVFTNVGNKCADCHADIHRRQFGATCEQCHTVKGWRVSVSQIRQHSNRFPLVGAHAAVECDACHKSGRFQGISTDCLSCHSKNFQTVTTPSHQGFPTTCQSCHTMNSWFGAKFDHAKFTGFALSGAHAALACASCHTGGRYKGTSADCYTCHVKEFTNTKNPNHVQAGFPHTCATCHNTATWQGATFDHNRFSTFTLTGAHVNVACTSCHVNGRFTGTPRDCNSCHSAEFQRTTNPNHATLGFPRTCESCHNTTKWQGATFNHNQFSTFALTGAHVNVACTHCHVNGRFTGTPRDCASCHMPEYQRTTNPNHAKAGFPTDCSLCHSTSGWPGAKFDHSKTQFPLTGAHMPLACSSCHSSGTYSGLDTKCVSCHMTNYQNTRNPNHVASGFPTECAVCHTTTAWTPASFDHSRTAFPLTGAHVRVGCANCHVGGRYAGTPTDCYACHKTDYNNVANPNHIAAHFPTTCATCHNTNTWSGATFVHSWFPIYSGNHAGKWTTCADCHTNPANFTVFSCTTCHEHEKTSTDNHHRGVRNYVYNSANCYACHPQGRS